MESLPGAQLDVEELYRQYGHAVLRRIRRFYLDDQAEEVLHEVFERVMYRLDSFRGDSHPLTWLYQVATRHCLNRIRNERRRRSLLQENPAFTQRETVGPRQEAEVFLGQLWRHLDEELSLIGTYYYVDGMTQADIGKLMGCTGRTISNRLRDIAELARELSEGSGVGS
jgi:RNA polymerase sigma-70 factor (ECF subfamily)